MTTSQQSNNIIVRIKKRTHIIPNEDFFKQLETKLDPKAHQKQTFEIPENDNELGLTAENLQEVYEDYEDQFEVLEEQLKEVQVPLDGKILKIRVLSDLPPNSIVLKRIELESLLQRDLNYISALNQLFQRAFKGSPNISVTNTGERSFTMQISYSQSPIFEMDIEANKKDQAKQLGAQHALQHYFPKAYESFQLIIQTKNTELSDKQLKVSEKRKKKIKEKQDILQDVANIEKKFIENAKYMQNSFELEKEYRLENEILQREEIARKREQRKVQSLEEQQLLSGLAQSAQQDQQAGEQQKETEQQKQQELEKLQKAEIIKEKSEFEQKETKREPNMIEENILSKDSDRTVYCLGFDQFQYKLKGSIPPHIQNLDQGRQIPKIKSILSKHGYAMSINTFNSKNSTGEWYYGEVKIEAGEEKAIMCFMRNRKDLQKRMMKIIINNLMMKD